MTDDSRAVPAAAMVGGKILSATSDDKGVTVTVELPEFRVLRDLELVGAIVLDPAYTPPWPGAGLTVVS